MAKPKERSIFDMPPDAAAEARLDAEAESDVAAGRVVPHERVREWLKRLANSEKVPPPRRVFAFRSSSD
jgi:predicted transcriptional regulator